MNDSPAVLTAWQGYYTIIGSAGGALIGLQFVVIALIANVRLKPNASTLAAFGTPTVLHFAGALVVAAVMCAPWPALSDLSYPLAFLGVVGLGYGAMALHHLMHQDDYSPDWEDWLWFVILPVIGYVTLILAALLLTMNPHAALFAVAGVTLGLLLIGIHNAWDSVTHLIVNYGDSPQGETPRESPAPSITENS
jgi:hypothetical protein